jgi:hypothetical protein
VRAKPPTIHEMNTAMKMIAITVTLAVVLGVAVMLAPVLSFMYVYPAVVPMDGIELQGGRENNQSAAAATPKESYGQDNQSASSADEHGLYRSPLSIAEAAQVYGTTDADAKPFSSSLLQVVPVIGGGFIAGFAALLYLKKKISQE